MNDSHREIQTWLDKLFGGEAVPQYEINPRTTEILWELKCKNEFQDRTKAIVIEDLQQKIDEYSAEADRLARLLRRLGLTPSSLSQSGSQSVQALASTALLLEVRDATPTSLMLGLTELQQKQTKLKDQRRSEQRSTDQLFSKTKAALHRYNTLKKALETLDEQVKAEVPELERKAKKSAFLKNKAAEYKREISSLQVEFSKTGATPEVYHQTLVEKSEELKQLKEKLHPMKAKLDSYHKLPPDLSLAKVQVEESKTELASLEAELAKHINFLHF